MPFLGPGPDLRVIGPTRFQLLAPVAYQGTSDAWTIPAGFTTDLASVPELFVWLIPRYGAHTRAAVVHDWLCALNRRDVPGPWLSRRDADGVFRRLLRELGVSPARRWLMWAAVRYGSHWAGGPTRKEQAQLAALAVPGVLVGVLSLGPWIGRALLRAADRLIRS